MCACQSLQLENNKYYIFQKRVSVSFVIQHAKHILHSILLHVPSLLLPYFITLSYNGMKNLLSTSCSANLSITFMILSTIQRDIVINVYSSSCNVDVILVRLQWNLYFLYRFL